MSLLHSVTDPESLLPVKARERDQTGSTSEEL